MVQLVAFCISQLDHLFIIFFLWFFYHRVSSSCSSLRNSNHQVNNILLLISGWLSVSNTHKKSDMKISTMKVHANAHMTVAKYVYAGYKIPHQTSPKAIVTKHIIQFKYTATKASAYSISLKHLLHTDNHHLPEIQMCMRDSPGIFPG